MPKLKHLSGKDVIRFCEKYGFTISRQKGSHVNLVRMVLGKKQVVTIPDHTEIDRGTLHSIYRQLMYFISEKDLREFFYTGNR
jgi:predicted RNA binding protein YcfA (HicA-like mRNA interferase family)